MKKKFLLASMVAIQLFISSIIYSKNETIKAGANIATTNTTEGKIQGYIRNNISIYFGVPYATTKRFEEPKKLGKRDEIFPAWFLGKISEQNTSNPMKSFFFSGPALEQGENPLNLNIWSPKISEKDNKKRAVMVWLHGGGFQAGSSHESDAYNGENLARTGDVVVVSVNHRLNSVGFLDLSAYGREYKNTGNLGVMDMVASLEWIKENIADFGGDPNNVTIFGESGGGAKVLTLMATPAVKGLFHKAIVQSGAVERMGMTLTPKKASQRVAELTLKNLGIKPNEVEKIKNVPFSQLEEASNKALEQTAKEQNLKAVRGGGIGLAWAPTMDGEYIPVEPVGEKMAAQSKGIPLLIGSNLTEWETIYAGLFADMTKSQSDNRNTWTETQKLQKLTEKYGEKTQKLIELFRKAYPERNIVDLLYIDTFLRTPALKTARLKAEQGGAPVYNYMFNWDTPVLGGFAMSFHTAEIPFVFNNIKISEKATSGSDEAQALSDRMSSAWVNFAKTGNPNGKGLPTWKPYNRENGETMIFDKKIEVKNNHDLELMKLLIPDYNF